MSKPFELGKTYKTLSGKSVTIIEMNTLPLPGYETVRGDDMGTYEDEKGKEHTLGWRYNRESDRGRCTGSAFDMSDPNNLVPEDDAQ